MSARTRGWHRGWATRRRGCKGRITLNPMYHIDPIGTLLFPAMVIFGPLVGFHLPFMLVGWAKPTPVITRNFKKIVRDDNLVTLAGPVSNLILVLVALAGLTAMAVAMPNGGQMVRLSFAAALGFTEVGGAQPVALLLSLAILNQPVALLLQPAAHSAARRQPRGAEHAAV